MNREKRFNLPTEGLSDAGRSHMQELGKALDWSRFDIIGSSPMARARESLKMMNPPEEKSIITVEGFHERDFGDWVGHPAEEVTGDNFATLGLMFGLYPDIPGGESLHDMSVRVEGSLKDLFNQYPGQRLLVVTHAITMHIIDHIVTGFPLPEITNRPRIANGDMREWEVFL